LHDTRICWDTNAKLPWFQEIRKWSFYVNAEMLAVGCRTKEMLGMETWKKTKVALHIVYSNQKDAEPKKGQQSE
jgi:hypothetical protein